ncbi:MAG: nuclear transport factor 2 family protein, partial [Anaerolineales bacterium]
MSLTGKGYYIWIAKQCEQGDPDRIAALAREANLSHVLIKIADGTFPYNVDLDNGFDYARPIVRRLQQQNIQVWGWQYVYGDYPDQEAEIAIARSLELGVNGFVVNAESQYKSISKAPAASRYMNILRNNLGSMPIALSSYRYPSYHAQFPWQNFLDRCDYNMPQVYWMQTHNNAGQQLQRSVNEFMNLRPFRPIIPTGATFKEHGWVPYASEVVEFMQTAKKLNLSAINFWYWEGCRRDLPHLWDVVSDFQYGNSAPQVSLPDQYISALNDNDLDKVLDLYAENAVHINAEHAVQGKNEIRAWIGSLMDQYQDCTFSLLWESNNDSIISFQ